MSREPFGFAEGDRRGPQRRERPRVAPQQRGALDEVEHAETGGEARRARGRQHVIGAADIIADRLGREGAEKDGADVVDAATQRVGVAGDDFQMLGREPIDQRRRRGQAGRQNDRAEIAPARAGDRLSRQPVELAFDSCGDLAGEPRVVGDQDRLRRLVMLGLRQEIGGDELWVGRKSASTTTSDGPAIMSMPTTPNTRRLAAAT